MFSNPFLRFCLLCLLCLAPEGLKAQTVIDLHTGRISAKTKDDYNVETRERWQIERDSLEYIDCLTRAFNHLHTDSLLQAQDLFERALRLRPDAPGNYVVEHNLGRIAMARGQWREAVNRLDKVLQSQPSMADAREDRAACYLQLAMFDRAENAFLSAYRRWGRNRYGEEEIEIVAEYLAAPQLEGKTLMLVDPMLATGMSMEVAYRALLSHGTPAATHLCCTIGTKQAVQYLQDTLGDQPNITLWCAAIDPMLNEHKYIVPGLGDAGDLCFGEKL